MIKIIFIIISLSMSMVSIAHAQQKSQRDNKGKKQGQPNVEKVQRESHKKAPDQLPRSFKMNDTTVTISGSIRAETTHKSRR